MVDGLLTLLGTNAQYHAVVVSHSDKEPAPIQPQITVVMIVQV